MAEENDSAEKEHEPTQRKLDEARKKGEIPRSTELNTAAAYSGLLIAALIPGAAAVQRLGDGGMVLLDRADDLARLFLTSGSALPGGLLLSTVLGAAPFILLPGVMVLVGLFAMRALVFAPDKLKPKLSRISPISNAKQKFGRSGLFEFAKSCVRLTIISVALWLYLMTRLPDIVSAMHLAPGMIARLLAELVIAFLGLALLIALSVGAVDYLWQRHDHLRKNRMSRKEMMDEMKQSEGDPHMKQQRRQRAYDIATNRMLTDVPKADVVIVNPTHYAVALKWDRSSPGAPVCLAKGVDEIAARIRELAAEAGVPVHADAPTARAIHATVEIGQEIKPDHYRAVAAAIRFSEAMRAKAKGGWK